MLMLLKQLFLVTYVLAVKILSFIVYSLTFLRLWECAGCPRVYNDIAMSNVGLDSFSELHLLGQKQIYIFQALDMKYLSEKS